MLEEEFEVLGAGESFPVGVGAVDEVEEGEIRYSAVVVSGEVGWGGSGGVHRDQHEGRGKGHADDAPDHLTAVHGLALLREFPDDARDLIPGEEQAGEDDVVLFTALDDGLFALRGEGGDGLEAPFLEGDALEGLVAGQRHALLPGEGRLFVLLPGDPCLARLVGELVEQRALAGGLLVQLLAVQQRAARGDGQQEEAHGCAGGAGRWLFRFLLFAGCSDARLGVKHSSGWRPRVAA